MTTYAHVAVASLNQTVGDWTGNRLKILEVVQKAKIVKQVSSQWPKRQPRDAPGGPK